MTPPNLSLLLIMICFWLTLWLVNRYLIVPIREVLERREEKIEGSARLWLERQDALRAAGEKLEAELGEAARKATALRNERRNQAQALREERLAAARKAAAEKLEEAVQKLAREGESARSELREASRALAAELAGRLLGREIAR